MSCDWVFSPIFLLFTTKVVVSFRTARRQDLVSLSFWLFSKREFYFQCGSYISLLFFFWHLFFFFFLINLIKELFFLKLDADGNFQLMAFKYCFFAFLLVCAAAIICPQLCPLCSIQENNLSEEKEYWCRTFYFSQQDEQQSSQISHLGAFDGANSMHFSGQSVNDEEIWIPAESELSPTISPQYETPTFSGKLNFLALKPVKK